MNAGTSEGHDVKRGSRGYNLVLRPEEFCIHRLAPDAVPDLGRLRSAGWYAIARSEEELSVVSPRNIDLGSEVREEGWSCLRVAGKLDFTLVGVIADIAGALAAAQVSVFVVSSYDTDYILIKTADINTAVRALTEAGHTVT
jgi:hypothetical protein